MSSSMESRVSGLSSQALQYEEQSLQEYARSLIPAKLWRRPGVGSYENNMVNFDGNFRGAEHCPINGGANDDFAMTLVKWFKYEFFKWVNKPKCEGCGRGGVNAIGTCPPSLPDEIQGRAGRVELYKCESCGVTTRFPRYNDPRTLLSPLGRRGRCGEFANAFACLLRSVGFEVRYVLDFTDHVWCEFYSDAQDRWVHVDPCEAKVDGCGIYEKGWGKKLSYIFAASRDEICEVTGKYSRKLHSNEFKSRRSLVPELVLAGILDRVDREHKSKIHLSNDRRRELQRRRTKEVLEICSNQGKDWGDLDHINVGRQTGSFEWRRLRGELGSASTANTTTTSSAYSRTFNAPIFQPASAPFKVSSTLIVHPKTALPNNYAKTPFYNCDRISVDGVNCCLGLPGVNAVALHPTTHCLMESRAFDLMWRSDVDSQAEMQAVESFKSFLDNVYGNFIVVIVAIAAKRPPPSEFSNYLKSHLGIVDVLNSSFGIVRHPSAKVCPLVFSADETIAIELRNWKLPPSHEFTYIKLEGFASSAPSHSLPAQSAASSDVNPEGIVGHGTVGFTTNRSTGHTVLLTNKSFPLFFNPSSKGTVTTTLRVPSAVIPKPFTVPKTYASLGRFQSLLGVPSLLERKDKDDCKTYESNPISSCECFLGAKLILLYFSASWCPPCRAFTPRLVEFYNSLKADPLTQNDIEIVFVTSDRTKDDFESYYSKMPWLSMPYDDISGYARRSLSSTFGIRGIPSLVVLDCDANVISSSGVNDVSACSSPEEALAIWSSLLNVERYDEIDREWAEGKTLHEERAAKIVSAALAPIVPPPVPHPHPPAPNQAQLKAAIKKRFEELKESGMIPNKAAAQAIREATSEIRALSLSPPTPPPAAPAWFSKCTAPPTTHPDKRSATPSSAAAALLEAGEESASSSTALLNAMLDTLSKYVSNAAKNVSEPKFRMIKSSNSVFHSKILSVPSAATFLTSFLHFDCYFNGVVNDTVFVIPKDLNLEETLNYLASVRASLATQPSAKERM